ncbi:MAG: PAS domain-containing sensor histidine kinase [Gemmatimonadota bacterium]|nr:PAS domain-containing sensor histidine kinase [Gemmatimonadota bacterium]
MMDPQQQGTVVDAREAPRKTRDTSALQYKELLASRDAIDRERQKYFELFELAPDACFLTDVHGTIREANVAAGQLLGVPAQFLAGKSLPGFFEESARLAFRQQLDQLSGAPTSDDWEIQVRPRNGAPTDVSVSIALMTARDKSLGAYRWVVRDISRYKQAENSVRELNRDLEMRVASPDFLALLSHEFRTPLQAIFGYTELLEREIHGPLTEPQRLYLQRIQQSQQLLLGLITTILDFAKLESGQSIDLALHPTGIHDVLAHVEGLVGAELEEKELNYSYRSVDRSIVANADAGKVEQILLNLLGNAIKSTDRKGSISVECELEPAAVAIRVIDTGKGIPAEKLEAIFAPFVQLKTKGEPTNGTGLGLPISRRLATAMGGSLTAQSEINKGSTFTLRLQRATFRVKGNSLSAIPSGDVPA